MQRIALERQRRKKFKTHFYNDAEFKNMINPYDVLAKCTGILREKGFEPLKHAIISQIL